MREQAKASRTDREPSAFEIVASCAALVALGIAQPLLDLLGRNPEFFLARDSEPVDVVILGVALGIVVPVGVGLVVIAIRRVNRMAGKAAYLAIVSLLAALIVLQVLVHTTVSENAGWVVGLASIVCGLFFAYALHRWNAIQSMTNLAAIAVLAVPATFLLLSPTSDLTVRANRTVEFADISLTSPRPVVVLIFDELPLASLIDGDGELQSDVYPGFARLAADATWFRNAITIERLTQFSVPAILSGVNPGSDFIPTTIDYPGNLFTLLGTSYHVRAMESLTDLCPPPACPEQASNHVSAGQRWESTLADLSIVAGHVFLPADLTDGLPRIDQNWAGFAEQPPKLSTREELREAVRTEVQAGRGATLEGFIDSISSSSAAPTLYVAHSLLPHTPWDYLPTGQRYLPPIPLPGAQGQGWSDDEWLVNQAYQHHLVQTMYVDHLVGLLIQRLEDVGLYGEAIVVVTADHGITFQPGIDNRRAAASETVGELVAIPLFIKGPGLSPGAIDDYRAETVDILPTIADALGVTAPWETDGISLISADRPTRTESAIPGVNETFGTSGNEKVEIAARKIHIFGNGGPFGLAPDGMQEFLGAPIADLQIVGSGGGLATVDLRAFRDIDLNDEFLPSVVSGMIDDRTAEEFVVAIGVNGAVAAITRTYIDENGNKSFYALLPPESLRAGNNDVRILVLDDSGSAFVEVG